MQNVLKKTGWEPVEVYFNDINAEPHVFKESALKRFIFPKYGTDGAQFYAVESNPKTRAMYKRYGIHAEPYSEFIRKVGADGKVAPAEPEMQQARKKKTRNRTRDVVDFVDEHVTSLDELSDEERHACGFCSSALAAVVFFLPSLVLLFFV